MEDYDIMTREEAEKKMEVLRQIFPIVRLVRGYTVMDLNGKTGAMEGLDKMETAPPCECFAFWQKNEPCRNCISQRMMEEHGQTSKLEFLSREMYQVTARYVEIDGEPYVMEMLQKQDSQNFIDEDGCKKLIGSLMKYNHMVYMDALTGVYNRRYFEDEIKNKTNTAGVAVIDMDYLKVINDTYGHRAGDHAIEMMVNVIRQNIRKTDSLIRYGGDEFLLILPEISKDSFNEKLKMIQEKIHDTAIADYGNLRLSVSIGGVITGNEPIENAVGRADRLMYQAKNQKNRVVTEHSAVTEENADIVKEEQTQGKQQILIVDDSDINREILSAMLCGEYRILEAVNGSECLKILQQQGTGISLVLLDIVMPVMDGFEVLSHMNRNHWIDDIPVILISGEDADSVIRRAYEMGVSDYINRPFDAGIVCRRVFNTVKLYAKQRRLVSLMMAHINEREKNNHMMIDIQSHIVEFRNGESGKHVLHMDKVIQLLLDKIVQKTDKYPSLWQERILIRTASALHDIGKIGIDEAILNKPGRLTAEEFESMKAHTTIGADMLRNLPRYQEENSADRYRNLPVAS